MNGILSQSISSIITSTTLWKYFFGLLTGLVLLHGFICMFFGISINWINPFLMKVCNVGISLKKYDIKIRSVNLRFSIFSSSKVVIVLEGVNVLLKSRKTVETSKEEEEEKEEEEVETQEKTEASSDFNTNVPLCVFPKSPAGKFLSKIYLLYFRFVGVKIFDLNVTWENTDITLNSDSILAKVSMTEVDGKYNFKLNIRVLQESFNDIELFDTVIFDVAGCIDMENGNLSSVKLGSELRNMQLGWLPLLQILAKMEKKHNLAPEPKKKEEDIIKNEEYFIKKFEQKLTIIRYFVNLVEEVNLSLHGFSLRKIPLANKNIVHCHQYHPLVFFELNIKSFVFNISRMYFDSPGYGLSYDFEDKPYHAIYNFTGISLVMNNTKMNTFKEIVSVPVMNFTGSSNYAFQTLKAAKSGQQVKSRIIFIGHVSEPIIDFSTDDITTAVLSYLQYSKHQETLRQLNMIPKEETSSSSTMQRMAFFKRHQHILPIFDFKFGIENPVVMLKSKFQEEFYRMLVLKLSLLSFEIKSSRNDNQYYTQHKFNIHNLKAKYMNNAVGLEENIFTAEDITLKQRCDVIPEILLDSSLDFQQMKLDASDIRVLHGLNYMFNELQRKLSPLLQSFRTHTNEFGCNESLPCDLNIPKVELTASDIEKSFEEERLTLVQIAEELLPSWLNSIKASFNQSSIILGSRSLLLSKELMKVVEPQTKNDLVGGELRKFELNFESFNILAKLKSSIDESDVSSSGSSLEDDDKGLSDSQASTDDSSLYSTRWKISCNVSKIIGKVISEKSSKRDVLKEKVFLKAVNGSFELIPQEQQEKILLKWDFKKIDLLYSVMTHFLIISSIHLLRNTILEFILHMKPVSKKPSLEPELPTRSHFLKIKIISMVEVHKNVECFDLILILPDRLKLRLELSKLNAVGKMDAPVFVQAHYTRLCAESPTAPGTWTRLVTAVNGATKVDLPTILEKGPGNWFELENETCNLTIPNRFVIYKIFENITVMFKTLKQLHHSLKFNTNEFIINPSVKPAIKVPKLNVKSRRFIFSMDDDPFEAELNMIFQIGIVEQKMRYEKTKLFEQKIAEEFEHTHKVKTRTTTFDADKDHYLRLLDDFSSFIPISKKKGIFQKKHNHANSNSNLTPSSASASIPVTGDIHNTSANTEMGKLKDTSKIIHERVFALRESYSKSWITRVKNFRDKMNLEFQSSFEFLRGNMDLSKLPPDFNRKVLEYSLSPSLMNLIFEGLDLDIGPPDYGTENVPNFIHDIGKGVPKETEYSILIPVHIDLKLKELRCHIRDYPLPLIHMPAITKFEPKNLPGIRVHGNYVIAEAAIQSKREVREVYVPLVPGCKQFDEDDSYSLEVPKTLTAIKSYVELDWELNSRLNTAVTWGSSYSPCIQQIMLNLDNFTKPPIDPSEKIGFWDKIRVLFHARMKFSWNYGGALLIQFKASKDPYAICAESAGFTLGFEKDVVLQLNEKDNPSEFLVVDSKKITFGVPNHIANPLLVWSRETSNSVLLSDPASNFHSSTFGYYIGNHEKPDPVKAAAMKSSFIEKSVITLSGGVQFKFAIAFERKLGKIDRSSSFKPHYDVYLSNPKYVKDLANFDSYADFRSHFIHLGFTLISTKEGAYNKIQLSPLAFQHFFSWWRMFSNTLSVRHGALFGPLQESTKFSRHLYTIKYQAIVEPLFISDIYHDNESVHKKYEKIECVGVKGRASKFVLDLHQRKELTFDHNPNLGQTKRRLSTKFNIGKVDIRDLDVRAVKGDFVLDKDVFFSAENKFNVDNERFQFEGFDNDTSWFDFSDFIEIGKPLMSDYEGKVFAYPLMSTPRFVYFKHNSYGDEYQRDFETNKKIKPFGNEEFHKCTINEKGSLAATQCAQLSHRLDELEEKLEHNSKEIACYTQPSTVEPQKNYVAQLKLDNEQIRNGMKFVNELIASYKKGTSKGITDNSNFDFVIADVNEGSKFTNRFTVHNMLLKWNDTNRNIIYKFIYLSETSSTQKKFLQHKSLGQLDDLIEDQRLANLGSGLARPLSRVNTYETNHTSKSNACEIDDLTSSDSGRIQNFKQELHEIMVSFFYRTHDNYFVKLISPQIQLQTELDESSCLLVAAPNIELNIIAFDANETEEEYNENIFEQRFGAILSNASIFMFSRDEVIDTGKLFFTSSSYGSNEAWPPWLGAELCYDGSLISRHVLMNKTSLVFRYDRAIASAFIPTEEHNINKLVCDLSQAVITCDSQQYYTLYNIATQLLIYTEPREAAHKEREAKMLFSLDMNDLASIRTKIVQLQSAVRLADYILQNLATRRTILDDLQKDDMNIVASARQEAAEELHILMHVALMGNSNVSETSSDYQEWFIRADDIKLHLLDESRDPFLDVILFNCHFKRVERSDRSDRNIISIQNLEVINLDKSSNFPVIFSSYQPDRKKKQNEDRKIIREDDTAKLIQVFWNMDHPVGGIRVMKRFEVDLLPVQISLEESTGDKIVEFVFPDETPSESFDLDSNDLESTHTRKSEMNRSININNGNGHTNGNSNGNGSPFKRIGSSGHDSDISRGSSIYGKPSSASCGPMDHIKNHRKGLFKENHEPQRDANLDAIVLKKTPSYHYEEDFEENENGVDEMVKRASNYLSFIAFRLRSGSISITFRGNGSRRLINVTDFVLNLPDIAFLNKTYTLLDVTMHIKKAIIKALLSHTGSIISNKLFKYSDGHTQKAIEGVSNYSNARIRNFRE